MTDRVLLASNTLLTSVTFFACSQVVFAFSLSPRQKQRQTALNNQSSSNQQQNSSKTTQNLQKQDNSTKQHKTAHNSTKAQ
jgi:hypothetical protein